MGKCDFTVDQKGVVASTLDGVIHCLDITSQKMTVSFDTLEEMNADPKANVKSNICFCVKSLKNHPDGGNKFAIGAEMNLSLLLTLIRHVQKRSDSRHSGNTLDITARFVTLK